MAHCRSKYAVLQYFVGRIFVLGLAIGTLASVMTPAGSNSLLAAPAEEETEWEPKPKKDVSLKTEDGLEMTASYYEGIKSRETVPIIMLHGYKGDRRDFDDLALAMQKLGHAVIVPDLRGHGDSKQLTNALSGKIEKLDAATLRPADFTAMVEQDVEAVKRHLMKRNNREELNIDNLCVIGADLGASVAIKWAALDWNWPELAAGKQGQDVKALVLVSTDWNRKGLAIQDAVSHPAVRSKLSTLIIAGKGKPSQDAQRLYDALKKFHPTPLAEEAEEKQDLFILKQTTSLQGTKLLNEKSLHLEDQIARFIELRVVVKKNPWKNRKSLLQ